MSAPVARAHGTLTIVGLLLAVAAILVDRAARDVDQARDELRAARNARIDAQAEAEAAREQLDGALGALHERMAEDGDAELPAS